MDLCVSVSASMYWCVWAGGWVGDVCMCVSVCRYSLHTYIHLDIA